MKRSITFLCASLMIMTFSRCNKKDTATPGTKPATWWTINNDTISYADIWLNPAPILTELRVSGPLMSGNDLIIAFRRGSLPHSGTYLADYTASDTASMCNVYVTYKGNDYNVVPMYNTTHVNCSTTAEGKGRYELEPTWFYRDLYPSDSILVRGVIIEP